MNDSLLAFKSLYLETAKQYLASMKHDLHILKVKPTDTYSLSDLYISSHSMKGQSSVMGFSSTSMLCHMLERIGHDAKEGSFTLSQDGIDMMLVCVEHLNQDLGKISKDNKEDDFSSEIKKLQEFTHIIV